MPQHSWTTYYDLQPQLAPQKREHQNQNTTRKKNTITTGSKKEPYAEKQTTVKMDAHREQKTTGNTKANFSPSQNNPILKT